MIDRLLVSHRFGITRYLDFLQGISRYLKVSQAGSSHKVLGVALFYDRVASSLTDPDPLRLISVLTIILTLKPDQFLGVRSYFIKLKSNAKLSKSFAPVTHYYRGFFIAFRFVVI